MRVKAPQMRITAVIAARGDKNELKRCKMRAVISPPAYTCPSPPRLMFPDRRAMEAPREPKRRRPAVLSIDPKK
jgi:hypothetical protein